MITLCLAAVLSSAQSEDLSTIDKAVAAVYDVISGPAGQKRDWDRFRGLFASEGRMWAVVKSKAGAPRLIPITVEDYVTKSGPYLEKNGFFEKEVSRRMEQYGNIAQVFSTYESRTKPDDKKPFERGINSIQLYFDGKRWSVVSIYWQGEDSTTPLPAKYLKRG